MRLLRAVCLISATCVLAAAGTLNVSVSGQFSSAITATQLADPGGDWALNFTMPSVPAVSNADSFGFDGAFSSFSYKLNAAVVEASPESIRFSTAEGFGLFTLFFGPESGYDSSGNAIPELSFEGAQVFSGWTSMPAILPGSYSVTSWNYSDSLNYDQHNYPGDAVTITAASIPESSTVDLLLFATAAGIGLLRRHSLVFQTH